MQNDQQGCALCAHVGGGAEALPIAERPIQKGKKKSCFHSQNNYPLYSTPDTYTTNLAATQRNKSVPLCMCRSLWGVRQGMCPTQGKLPNNLNPTTVAGKPHRMVANILKTTEKINAS